MKGLSWNVLSVKDDLRALPLHWLLIQSHHTRTFCLQPACSNAGQDSVFLIGLTPLETPVLTLWNLEAV